MKTRAMFVLIAVMAGSLIISPAFAQRGGGRAGGGGGRVGGGGGGRPAGSFGGRAIPTNPMNSPSTPIQPMTNPVAPFVNYNHPSGPTMTSPVRSGNFPQPLSRGGFDRRRDGVVVVDGGYIASPYSYGFDPYAYGLLTPAPIPGQLPNYYPYPPPTVPGQLPNTYSLLPPEPYVPVVDPPPAPSIMRSPDPVYYPEPEIIIPVDSTKPKEVPALFSTRADVEAKYGEPWGVIVARGKETVYYRGGLMVVYEAGRVAEVQKR
jgi:hypothetical protein